MRIPPIVTAMTPFPYAIEADKSLVEAREMMEEHRIHHLPVKRQGRLYGVLSQRDMIQAMDQAHQRGSEQLPTVGEVCVSDAYVVDVAEPLDRVALHMADQHIGSALVTKQGRLAGVFTTLDACRVLAELLHKGAHPPDTNDAA